MPISMLLSTACHLMRASHAMQVYSSNSGYTASAFLAGETEPAMKGTDAQELHASAIPTTIHLAIMLVTQIVIIAAMSKGKMQYPSKHMDWKNPMLPPSSTTLHVRTTAPADNVAKTNCVIVTSLVCRCCNNLHAAVPYTTASLLTVQCVCYLPKTRCLASVIQLISKLPMSV